MLCIYLFFYFNELDRIGSTKSSHYRLTNVIKIMIKDIVTTVTFMLDKIKKIKSCRIANYYNEKIPNMFNGNKIYYINETSFIKNNRIYDLKIDTKL
jgi:hypothetical protein